MPVMVDQSLQEQKERVRAYIYMAILALPEGCHWKVRANLEGAVGFWLDYVDVCAKPKRRKICGPMKVEQDWVLPGIEV